MGMTLYVAQAPVNNKQLVREMSSWLLREQINNLALELYFLKYILKVCLNLSWKYPFLKILRTSFFPEMCI